MPLGQIRSRRSRQRRSAPPRSPGRGPTSSPDDVLAAGSDVVVVVCALHDDPVRSGAAVDAIAPAAAQVDDIATAAHLDHVPARGPPDPVPMDRAEYALAVV